MPDNKNDFYHSFEWSEDNPVEEEFSSFLKDHMADSFAIALDGLMHNARKWTSHDLMIEHVRAYMIKRYKSSDSLEEFINLCVHYACSDKTHLTLTDKE
tara:strand:+ start:1667 stop:1963 length:297 start_codon:yes stop_codon:yes gene_type:complete